MCIVNDTSQNTFLIPEKFSCGTQRGQVWILWELELIQIKSDGKVCLRSNFYDLTYFLDIICISESGSYDSDAGLEVSQVRNQLGA